MSLTALPPLSIPASLATRTSCEVTLDLRDTRGAARPVSPLLEYDAGLRALSNDEPLQALTRLRRVVDQDEAREYGSAAVLACLLSLQLGDIGSFRALRTIWPSYNRSDEYAARLVSASCLSISTPGADDASGTVLTECLELPDIAIQIATVGLLIQEDRLPEAAESLERIVESAPDSQLVLSAAHQIHVGDLPASARTPMRFPIGLDSEGKHLTWDLGGATNLLVAGNDGLEKTSFLHAAVCSLLMTTTPDDLEMFLFDPKMTELTMYDGIPNLCAPVITDAYESIDYLGAISILMDRRYKLAQELGARTLDEINEKLSPDEKKIPYLLIVIDEIADLMMISKKVIEELVIKIAQKGQVLGVHMMLTTQFPRGDVFSSSIKHAALDRIAFSTASQAESRIVIDTAGAQDLFGGGDCLYVHEKRAPIWVQSPYVTQTDIEMVVEYWRNQALSFSDRREKVSKAISKASQTRIRGIPETLCSLYHQNGRPDDVLSVVTRHPTARLDIWRAKALAQKGLNDAALLVYDELIQGSQSSTHAVRARYAKTKLLVDIGNAATARRELAQVYAAIPDFPDNAGLLAKLNAKQQVSTRSPIPESVRHAVWRRDEGRCVQCGNQERLEFDHIIPFSRGGSNTERNLQLLCESCNRKKSATI